MANSVLSRRLRFFERQWPWLLLAFGAAFVTLAVGALLDFGALEAYELFPRIVRGYTATGVLLGLGALSLAAFSFFYAFRKRGLQEHLPFGRATMTTWLWAHVYFGLLAVVVAGVHAGYGLFSPQISWGKAAFWGLFAVVGSGLVWRAIYAFVPAQAAREVGNYAANTSKARAEAVQIEIEKLCAGGSPRLHELKTWLSSARASEQAIGQAGHSLPPEEQLRFREIAGLSATRHDLLERSRKQARYSRLLQGMRLFHVPLSLLFLVAVPLHIFFAYDLPARVLPVGTVSGSALGGFEHSEACAECHQRTVDEWRRSMHAHGMTGPLMVAQSNQVYARVLAKASAPDPQRICVNCHGPLGAALTSDPRLPLGGDYPALSDDELLNEGVSCSVCHQWAGDAVTGGGGLSQFQRGLKPGHRYYGPIESPVGNAFHRSEQSALFKNPTELCRNCHSVQLDKNGDGKFQRGPDLVLQSLFDEWQDYRHLGGSATCINCHMPLLKETRAAEQAAIPLEQDHDADKRATHDHTFVATDYPLDDPKIRDQTRPAREALLKRAASLTLVDGSLKLTRTALKFAVEVKNVGSGHNLPGGFAFVRQMWIEASVLDAAGVAIASSGVLARPSDDLCDTSVLDVTSPMRSFVSGCDAADPLLVNFQQMLFDVTQVKHDNNGLVPTDRRGEALLEGAPGSHEVVIQYLTSGASARIRPFTQKPTAPLATGDAADFPYLFAVPAGRLPKTLRLRLLFRTSPPYFVRALASGEKAPNADKLAGLTRNLEVSEMASLDVGL
ncbi:MAG TPA: multiheme c-type cytochrome [Polyangiaceae bacterium]